MTTTDAIISPENRRIYLSLSGDAAAAAESSPRSAAARHSLSCRSCGWNTEQTALSGASCGGQQGCGGDDLMWDVHFAYYPIRWACAFSLKAGAATFGHPRIIAQPAAGQMIAGRICSVVLLPQLALVVAAPVAPAPPVPLAAVVPAAPPVTVLY